MAEQRPEDQQEGSYLRWEQKPALSNRGLVRRAQQELQSGELTFELLEDDAGTVTVRWSDGTECVLPAQRVVRGGGTAALGRIVLSGCRGNKEFPEPGSLRCRFLCGKKRPRFGRGFFLRDARAGTNRRNCR